jgi:hypothetical protein
MINTDELKRTLEQRKEMIESLIKSGIENPLLLKQLEGHIAEIHIVLNDLEKNRKGDENMPKSFDDIYTELINYLDKKVYSFKKCNKFGYKASKGLDLLNQIWHLQKLLKRYEQTVHGEDRRKELEKIEEELSR